MLLNFILKNGENGKLHIMYILVQFFFFFKAHEEMLKAWETGKEKKGVGHSVLRVRSNRQLIGAEGKI